MLLNDTVYTTLNRVLSVYNNVSNSKCNTCKKCDYFILY